MKISNNLLLIIILFSAFYPILDLTVTFSKSTSYQYNNDYLIQPCDSGFPHFGQISAEKPINIPFHPLLSTEALYQTTYSNFSSQYEESGPIIIYGDEEFSQIATMEGWPGDGTSDNPYIIESYNFTDSSSNLLSIFETSSFFIIRNNIFNGLTRENNAIELFAVFNGIIRNNTIINSLNGIFLRYCEDNTVINNIVYQSTYVGIRLEFSHFNRIVGNEGYQNSEHGIWLYESDDNILSGNLGHDNVCCGIKLVEYSDSNTLFNNLVYDNNEDGIWLDKSNKNLLSNNSMDSNYFGLEVTFSSNYNIITSNYFVNNVG
ncbi:MAG: right-handed parallel beta-helix repeat-containing protein [Candidatus Hodarchaeales archaeon]